jgi:hypothetical protein
MRRRIIAALVVVAGLTTAGVAYAENQPADPSVAAGPAAAKAGPRAGAPKAGGLKAGGLKAGVLKGAIHGDLLVQNEDGSTRTVTFDRGKVTAVDGSSISIERPDGASVSKTLTDQTAFNGKDRDELQAGVGVIVISDGGTAQRVISKGARKEAAANRCAADPAAGAGQGVRGRVKERICQRLEKRSSVVDESGSSVVADSFETILS